MPPRRERSVSGMVQMIFPHMIFLGFRLLYLIAVAGCYILYIYTHDVRSFWDGNIFIAKNVVLSDVHHSTVFGDPPWSVCFDVVGPFC